MVPHPVLTAGVSVRVMSCFIVPGCGEARDMGITKRGRKSFQTISNHRAAHDRELNNDTRQPGTRRQSADIIKTQAAVLTTVPSHQPQHSAAHLCVGIGFH